MEFWNKLKPIKFTFYTHSRPQDTSRCPQRPAEEEHKDHNGLARPADVSGMHEGTSLRANGALPSSLDLVDEIRSPHTACLTPSLLTHTFSLSLSLSLSPSYAYSHAPPPTLLFPPPTEVRARSLQVPLPVPALRPGVLDAAPRQHGHEPQDDVGGHPR